MCRSVTQNFVLQNMGPQVHILQNIWTPGTNFAAKSVPCHNLCSPVDGFLSYDPHLHLCWQDGFCTNISNPAGSCFSIAARKNRRGSAHFWVIQYRVSMMLAQVHLAHNCIGEVIAFGSQIYGVTPFTKLPHVTLYILHSYIIHKLYYGKG